jgi:ribosomal protein S7
MLLREYYKDKYKFVLALTNHEFIFFLNKFYGSLIFRGKKSLALNFFDNLIFSFKKKFRRDPFLLLHKALNNILPLLSSTQKKMGKSYQAVPTIAVGNRRFVIMLD